MKCFEDAGRSRSPSISIVNKSAAQEKKEKRASKKAKMVPAVLVCFSG
jgi:hypothetical protein